MEALLIEIALVVEAVVVGVRHVAASAKGKREKGKGRGFSDEATSGAELLLERGMFSSEGRSPV
jgi:hypothetical protein